jgi:RNA polymerase sigma-70 factor (ECF subfamily)
MLDADYGFATPLDAATLVRAQRGDRDGLEAIYRTYARAAHALCLRMLGRSAAAEDATHDAFVRAFERLHSYRGEAPFGAWLKRLVANTAIDRIRSERRWDSDADAVDSLESGGTEPQLAEAIGLLARLNPRARSVVWLHSMEGYSHAEIAARFGQSESWSKSQLARSLQRLRELDDITDIPPQGHRP